MSLTRMWTWLGSPTPRREPVAYTPRTWPIERSIGLPMASAGASAWLEASLMRRSRRTFAEIGLEQVGMLLWHTLYCQRTADSPLGFSLQQRPIPSAGAIHPVHLVMQVADDPSAWARYNPLTHALDVIGESAGVLDALRIEANRVVPIQSGSLLLFIAEPAMTAAKYENANSLVWRDAGVMQGALAMTAEALGLNFCLLGITGDPWVGQLNDKCQLVGVGVAALGTRP
jgi:SagB-type dehydrogenase family enzyme